MLIAELAALGAAFCWALSGLIIINPLRKIGGLALNRARMSLRFFDAGCSFSHDWSLA